MRIFGASGTGRFNPSGVDERSVACGCELKSHFKIG